MLCFNLFNYCTISPRVGSPSSRKLYELANLYWFLINTFRKSLNIFLAWLIANNPYSKLSNVVSYRCFSFSLFSCWYCNSFCKSTNSSFFLDKSDTLAYLSGCNWSSYPLSNLELLVHSLITASNSPISWAYIINVYVFTYRLKSFMQSIIPLLFSF
jgi:hypothetical protein